MLTLTENASDIVTTLVNSQVPSENGGLRISGPSPEGFAITAVLAGEPGDTLVESGEAKVYLEDAASQVLADKILDAQVTPEGNVQFQIADQPH